MILKIKINKFNANFTLITNCEQFYDPSLQKHALKLSNTCVGIKSSSMMMENNLLPQSHFEDKKIAIVALWLAPIFLFLIEKIFYLRMSNNFLMTKWWFVIFFWSFQRNHRLLPLLLLFHYCPLFIILCGVRAAEKREEESNPQFFFFWKLSY